MKRVFEVTVAPVQYEKQIYTFNVVAETAEHAISKAKAAGRRKFHWRSAWLVQSLLHKGAAV